jgi:di/tricarboxylate transporter
LRPATDPTFKIDDRASARCLIEAVVSDSCPVLGETIRDARFRSRYNAVVLAVARNGQRLNQKIGDITLRPGDTLLLESSPSFIEEHRNRRDFFLVSQLADSEPPRHDKAPLALAILIGMVAVVGLGWTSMLKAGLAAGAVMILTRCCSVNAARRSIDLETLLAIAASFGLGKALETTKAAELIASYMTDMAGGNRYITLAVMYLVTLIVTELITNNAAAALMFPFAMATAADLGTSYMPFVIVVMMAASAGFATPIGYQTNLMVYGPGGYRFSDYVKIGVPLDLLIFVVTVIVTPLAWPF